MAISTGPLGMNARNYLYIRPYNNKQSKRIADDKLETKRILLQHAIATPRLYASFESRSSVGGFDWSTLPEKGFVIKPARGYGGGGILAIRKWQEDAGITVTGEEIDTRQLEAHIIDVLEGGYSLQYLPDKALIEERLISTALFRKYGAVGLADLRVIVFHHVPVMAMLRFPTAESGGKANLHQGAIAFGIDMRTGITTGAFYKNRYIKYIPETKVKTSGIKIPSWEDILVLATKTQSVSGMGYAGIDIVIDKEGSPFVLEMNARPGLTIQNANRESLRTRLERVEHMPLPSPKRGVEVAKSLFAKPFAEKVKTQTNILTVIQHITILQGTTSKKIKAKLDTGAQRSSIDKKLVEELGLEYAPHKIKVKSATGKKPRKVVYVTFQLAGKKIHTTASVADRSKLEYPMIIGRQDLDGFLIKPAYFERE